MKERRIMGRSSRRVAHNTSEVFTSPSVCKGSTNWVGLSLATDAGAKRDQDMFHPLLPRIRISFHIRYQRALMVI